MHQKRVEVTVPGDPVPWTPKQTNFKTGNRFIPSRQAEATGRVLEAAKDLVPFDCDTPLVLSCEFWIKRPKGHWGTGRNVDTLKPSAPRWPTGRPDCSNLVKWIEDGLVLAGLIPDDDQVVQINALKFYTVGRAQPPGSIVKVIATSKERP